MSVHQLRPRTPAETALIERAEGAGSYAIGGSRAGAIEALRRDGLPTRRVEAWHYTDLRALMGRLPEISATSTDDGAMLSPLIAGSHVVDISTPETFHQLDGVKVSKLDETADFSTSSNHLDRAIDTVRLMNLAFGAPAVAIDVEAGTTLSAPLELRTDTGARAHGLTRVTVGDRASATIVERLEGEGGSGPSTGISHLAIGDGATAFWIVDQEKALSAAHLGQLNVTIGADAVFKMFVLNAGGAVVRYEVHAETRGENSEIKIRGVNLIEAGQHIDVTTTLRHTVPHTTATETFRNVVTGGHGVFQGMIKVAREAQKTDAKMACNTLLLSDEGDFSAKPELEIFADDVQCGHGATAGEINAEHLFYLMSRGIPEKPARALLVKAFVAEVVEELEDEAAGEALMGRIDRWLGHEG